MGELVQHIFVLLDECVHIAGELEACMWEERKCLVEFRIDDLPQTNLKKESLIGTLSRRRRELQKLVKFHYGAERLSDLASQLGEQERPAWLQHFQAWSDSWTKLRNTCEANQRFLKHSLKNLSFLVENLKRSLGDHSVYSAQGKRVDMGQAGKMLTARY